MTVLKLMNPYREYILILLDLGKVLLVLASYSYSLITISLCDIYHIINI